MIIYPTIELKNGRCVSLPRGKIEEASVWHVDPIAKAREFAQAGAEWMHLTDLDAVAGEDTNRELVARLIREAGLPVQLGGGFRSRDRVEEWIDHGAGRIVVGTLAAQNPHMVKELAERHVDQIVLSVDVWQGHVMIEGWKARSAYMADGFIKAFAETPFAAIVVTDIAADVSGSDASLGMIEQIARSTRVPVIASGIVRSLDDISRLQLLGDVSGALVGRALFNRTIDLGEAVALARTRRGHVAEFM